MMMLRLIRSLLVFSLMMVAACSEGGYISLDGSPAGTPSNRNPSGTPSGGILPFPSISENVTLSHPSVGFSSSSNYQIFGAITSHGSGVSSSESYRLVNPSLSLGEQKLDQVTEAPQ